LHGPNAKKQLSVLHQLKLKDNHYAGMVEVARDIKKTQSKNPDAEAQHLLTAQHKFQEND